MPPGHCGCDSVGYAAQCGHTGGDWRATNQRAAETEEAPVVRTPAERMPDHQPQKQLLRCRLRGKKRRPGGNSRHCHAVQWHNIEQSTSVRLTCYTVCSFVGLNAATQFSASEFLKKHETEFFEVVDPRLSLFKHVLL